MNQDLCDLIAVYNACQNKWLKGELGKLLVQAVGMWVNGPNWSLTAEEANLVIKGKKIDAVRAFKIRVNCTLMEAKNAIEASPEYESYMKALKKAQEEIF